MYDYIREDVLYIMLYAAVIALSILASCYLLFRRGNAFAADIKPPTRLRRWTAVFFAAFALNHLWYMPILFHIPSEEVTMIDLTGGLLDLMTFFPLAIIVLLVMLQDRRRPLWIVAVMMAPLVAGGVWSVVSRSYALLPMANIYFGLMCVGLFVYMVREVRRYGRWLHDNYADLEHKEVWQSFVVLGIIMLGFVVYGSTGEGPVYQYAMQVVIVFLICYLLWRVETLSDLSVPVPTDTAMPDDGEEETATTERVEDNDLSLSIRNDIGPLLKKYCEEPQLYLQHDLTLPQLAKAIGVNRFYLSQYFSVQGMNYNAYINDLRIRHFVGLYREAAHARRSVTTQQLALESGYKSYSTFRSVFTRTMGLSVTAWMKDTGEALK